MWERAAVSTPRQSAASRSVNIQENVYSKQAIRKVEFRELVFFPQSHKHLFLGCSFLAVPPQAPDTWLLVALCGERGAGRVLAQTPCFMLRGLEPGPS